MYHQIINIIEGVSYTLVVHEKVMTPFAALKCCFSLRHISEHDHLSYNMFTRDGGDVAVIPFILEVNPCTQYFGSEDIISFIKEHVDTQNGIKVVFSVRQRGILAVVDGNTSFLVGLFFSG